MPYLSSDGWYVVEVLLVVGGIAGFVAWAAMMTSKPDPHSDLLDADAWDRALALKLVGEPTGRMQKTVVFDDVLPVEPKADSPGTSPGDDAKVAPLDSAALDDVVHAKGGPWSPLPLDTEAFVNHLIDKDNPPELSEVYGEHKHRAPAEPVTVEIEMNLAEKDRDVGPPRSRKIRPLKAKSARKKRKG